MSCPCFSGKTLFNPSTQKVLFNPTTQKVMADIQPTHYTLTFSGIRKCSDDSLWAYFNKTWKLDYLSDCKWQFRSQSNGDDCWILLDLTDAYGTTAVYARNYNGDEWVFENNSKYGTCAKSGNANNEIYRAICGDWIVGYGGSVVWCQHWKPEGCP